MKLNRFVIFIAINLCSCTDIWNYPKWPSSCTEDDMIGDICYRVFNWTLTYEAAEDTCGNNDGLLAIIKDEETHEKIINIINNQSKLRDRIWIGINKLGNMYVYSDGTEMDKDKYAPWAYLEPSSGSRSKNWKVMRERCISMNPKQSSFFYDDFCEDERNFVCQYKSKSCNIQDIHIANGKYIFCSQEKKVPYNSKINIECQEGYMLDGPPKVKCLMGGKWSALPKCIIGCNNPPHFPNSITVGTKNHYIIGDTVTYICNEGYFSIKNPTRSHFRLTCSPKSHWFPSERGCSTKHFYKISGMMVNNQESTKLVCDIELNNEDLKKGTISWMKDSNELADVLSDYHLLDTGDLIISNTPSQNITGLYTCFFNGENIIPGNTVYDVKIPKDELCPYGSSQKKFHYTFKEGSAGKLSCPHSSEYIGFHWYKDDKYLALDSDSILYPDGTLFIRKVDFSHQGIYTCMMTVKDTFCTKNVTAIVNVEASAESICGNPSKAKDHPWTVSLWRIDEIGPLCYGALIHQNWVVTTAQCLSRFSRKRNLDIIVRLKSNSRDYDGEDDIPISSIKIHPSYSKERQANDIALAKLERSVKFSNAIQPICLTETDLIDIITCNKVPGLDAVSSGWGFLGKQSSGISNLAEETLTLVDRKHCFPSDKYINNVLCFEKASGITATFASDYGSPLEVFWNNRMYLLGIYSWGDRQSQVGNYEYFTQISSYVPWISTFLNVM